MLFWIIALAVAALTAVPLLVALLRGGAGLGLPDIAIYRDQLAEIDRDLARGTLPEAEAERARVEISRRILDADRLAASAAPAGAAPRSATLAAGLFASLLLSLGASGLYYMLGAPGYPDMPLKQRIAEAEAARAARPGQAVAEARLGQPPPAEVDPAHAALVAELRAVLAERPGDIQGLTLLARNEATLGDFRAAHAAQAQLVSAKGMAAEAADYTALAHYLVLAAGGYVSPEAEAALTEALSRDQSDPVARYYSGLLFTQTGRPDLAFRFWAALLADSPPDAPWVAPIRAEIGQLAFLAGQADYQPPPASRGPSAADLEAAAGMDPDAQAAMIRGMVAGLAERLASEGGPASDWAQLIRAYGVLGEAETAAPILAEARAVFAGDPAGLAEIEAAARAAGLAP